MEEPDDIFVVVDVRDVTVGFLSGTFRHPFGTPRVYDCVVTVERHDLILNAG